MEGYLAVPAGSYSLSSSQHSIWLEAGQLSDVRMTVKIRAGKEPNSMHFAYGAPRIKDNGGNIIPWMTSGGREIYVTNRPVIVRGIWRGECTVNIETIE